MLWGKEMGTAMEYSDAKTVAGPKQQGHCCPGTCPDFGLFWQVMPMAWWSENPSYVQDCSCDSCVFCVLQIFPYTVFKRGEDEAELFNSHPVPEHLVHKVILKNLVNPCVSSKCTQDYPTELLIHRTRTNEDQEKNRLYWVICVFGHPVLQAKSFL